VKAILFNEITDRPSSYFFSEYYNMLQEAPVVGKKKKLLLSDIKHGLTISGADIQTKTIASADMPTDVANHANTHGCDIVLLDLPYTKEEQTRTFSLTASFSNLDKKFQRAITVDASAALVNSIVSKLTCAAAILFHPVSSIHESHLIRNVLFVYNGENHEARALHFVTHLSSSISITVLAKNRSSLGTDIPANIKTIESVAPEKDAVEEYRKVYDLMIMGSERGYSSVLDTDAVKLTDIPLLIVYPERDPAVSKHFEQFKMLSSPHDSIEV